MQITLSCSTHLTGSSIDLLQNALTQIASWVSGNLLTLNSSETEFLLIGLSKQLANIHNSSLNTTHSARHLGFILHENLIRRFEKKNVQIRCIESDLRVSKCNPTVEHSSIHICQLPILAVSRTISAVSVPFEQRHQSHHLSEHKHFSVYFWNNLGWYNHGGITLSLNALCFEMW